MKNFINAIIVLFGILFGACPFVLAQDIDKTAVEKQVKKLFQDYEYYGTLVESFNDETVSESVIGQFKNLFDPSAMVYNDIKQSENYGKKISLQAYINELKTWYPSGLSTSLSPPQLGNIVCNKGKCQINVPVSKTMGGLTKMGADFRENDILLVFVISFTETLQNFKILGINNPIDSEPLQPIAVKPDKKPKQPDNSAKNEATAKADKPKEEKVKTERLKPIKNKPVKTENVFAKGNNQKAKRSIVGLYTGIGWTWLAGLGDFSPLAGSSSEALSEADALFAEDFSIGTRPLSYRAALGINRIGLLYQRYLGEKFGFSAGIGWHSYRSAIQGDIASQSYAINNTETGSNEPDNTPYLRSFEAKSFKEKYSYSNLTLSLGVQHQWYSYVRNNIFRPYIKGGLEVALGTMSPSVRFDGNINSLSMYDQNDLTYTLAYDESGQNGGKIYNDVYWLYGDDAVVNGRKPSETLIPKAAGLNLSPTAEVGFDWMLSKSSDWCLSVAAQMSLGVLPIFGTPNADIYGNSANNILLKRQYTGTDSSRDSFYDYTPLSENSYEYRSIHGADNNTTPHFLGFTLGLKYIFQKGK